MSGCAFGAGGMQYHFCVAGELLGFAGKDRVGGDVLVIFCINDEEHRLSATMHRLIELAWHQNS